MALVNKLTFENVPQALVQLAIQGTADIGSINDTALRQLHSFRIVWIEELKEVGQIGQRAFEL